MIFLIMIGRHSTNFRPPFGSLKIGRIGLFRLVIEAIAEVEPHKEVPVAKLHKEVDLVKAQNTVQVIMVGNQEEVAHPKDIAQEEKAHPKEEKALLEDAVQE